MLESADSKTNCQKDVKQPSSPWVDLRDNKDGMIHLYASKMSSSRIGRQRGRIPVSSLVAFMYLQIVGRAIFVQFSSMDCRPVEQLTLHKICNVLNCSLRSCSIIITIVIFAQNLAHVWPVQ